MDIIKLREKMHKILVKLMSKYKDNLNYYSKIPADEQSILGRNYNRFRAIQRFTEVMKDNNDLAFYEKKSCGFQHIYPNV
jgi:hypothetical protein